MRVLKPCPWCGGDASFEHLENARWAVGCDDAAGVDCYGFQSFTTFPTQKLAAQAWNTRIDEPTPSQTVSQDRAVERLVNALELGHETLHQCTAVLSANDCATVAKAMLEMRQALTAFKKSELGHE